VEAGDIPEVEDLLAHKVLQAAQVELVQSDSQAVEDFLAVEDLQDQQVPDLVVVLVLWVAEDIPGAWVILVVQVQDLLVVPALLAAEVI
jgi:hypothetical protein